MGELARVIRNSTRAELDSLRESWKTRRVMNPLLARFLGVPGHAHYLIHDRDPLFTRAFRKRL
jgi:hypothetical protein